MSGRTGALRHDDPISMNSDESADVAPSMPMGGLASGQVAVLIALGALFVLVGLRASSLGGLLSKG